MKTLTANDIAIQNRLSDNINTIENVFLLKQYLGIIDEFVSTSTIWVKGGKSVSFLVNDIFSIPFDNIDPDSQFKLTDVYYDSVTDRTRLTFGVRTKDLDATYVGKYICWVMDVTNKMVDQTIKDIEITMETTELSQFDSGKLTVTLVNGDGYFRNKSKTGILDNGGVWWGVYKIKFKGGDTKIVFFSGLVELTDIAPDLYRKTIDIVVYGHSYELSRYPAYDISNGSDNTLTKMFGINIIAYIPSADSEPGVKTIKYSPFSTSKLKGVQVESVSSDTDLGIKVLEFRYPFYFRWDNGAWYSVSRLIDTDSDGHGGNTGKKTLYAKDGSGTSKYAVINFGNSNGLNEYPDSDSEDWINIKDNSNYKLSGDVVSQQGLPILSFDNGATVPLKIHFQRVLRLISSTYTDVSDLVNVPADKTSSLATSLLSANGNSIIIVAPERFWGIELIMLSGLTSGVLNISYSVGGDSFSSAINTAINGLSDSTNNLSNSGIIRWSTLENWLPNDIIVSASESYKGYMIKITRTTATGSCSVVEIKRLMRSVGINGDIIEFGFDQTGLSSEDSTDEIIIKRSEAGVWSFSVWYNSITVQHLLELALDRANYSSSKRSVGSLKINRSKPIFNVWGKPPKFSYPKYPSAVFIDFVDADNYTVYCSIGIELWMCTNKGLWTKVTTFGIYGAGVANWTIENLWKTGGDIFIFFRQKQDEFVEYSCGFGKYTLSTGVYSDIRILNFCHVGKECIRDGTSQYVNWLGTPFYIRDIGQAAVSASPQTFYFGENICIAFPQPVATETPHIASTPGGVLWPTVGNEGIPTAQYPEWYFDSYYTQAVEGVNSGPVYKSKIGFFVLHRIRYGGLPNLGFKHSFGNQGCVLIDKTNSDVYLFKHATDTPGTDIWNLFSMKNNTNKGLYYYGRNGIPTCHVLDDVHGKSFFGFTQFYDSGQNKTSYSYISLASLTGNNVINADKVIHKSGSVYTDVTLQANSGGNAAIISAVGQCIYICSTRKMRGIKYLGLNPTSKTYWNGLTWSPLPNTVPNSILSTNFFFDMPRDMVKTACPGGLDGNQYYVIKIECTTFSISENIQAGISEIIYWDSMLETGKERYMPVWLSYNLGDQYMYGCMFNRESSGISPYQWIPFALDLSTGTLKTTITGEDFTYDGTLLLKDFVYNANDGYHYCITEDKRYNEKPAFMMKMIVDPSGNLKLYDCGIPVENDWGSAIQMICNPTNGSIFGISKKTNLAGLEVSNKFWEYSKSFYARIEVAKFSDSESVKDIAEYVCQLSRCQMKITSERFVVMKKRSERDGTISLLWDLNMVQSNPSFGNWQHYYDAVKVSWKSYVTDENGSKKFGFNGWNKTVLSVDNSLIQTPHMAIIVGEDLFNYFNNYRIEASAVYITNLIQLECMDSFTVYIPNKIIDVDKTTEFIITSIKMNQNKSLELKGTEILLTDNV